MPVDPSKYGGSDEGPSRRWGKNGESRLPSVPTPQRPARVSKENAELALKIGKQDHRYKLGAKLITNASWVVGIYFVCQALAAFAGHQTSITAVLGFFANLAMNQQVAWCWRGSLVVGGRWKENCARGRYGT